jgi:aromatic ring-opening dioxygenase LigB subunit
VIWDALKAICETIELEDRYVVIESAGIIVAEEVGLLVIVNFSVYSL